MTNNGMRQSNFELLRIMCMLSIIGIHVYTQTNASRLTIDNGLNYIFIVFIAYGGRLVCNCYVMIGAWFLTESDFKAERVVNYSCVSGFRSGRCQFHKTGSIFFSCIWQTGMVCSRVYMSTVAFPVYE